MFSELGGYVQVQGSPRAGVSVATYTNGGLSASFAAKGTGFTGNVVLLPALPAGAVDWYILRQANLQPYLTGGEISLGDNLGGLADWKAGVDSPSAVDLLGLVCKGPVTIFCASTACIPPAPFPDAWLFVLRYDLVYAKPGIS